MDSFFDFLIGALIVFCIVVGIGSIIAEILVVTKYANVPWQDLPTWVIWFLWWSHSDCVILGLA